MLFPPIGAAAGSIGRDFFQKCAKSEMGKRGCKRSVGVWCLQLSFHAYSPLRCSDAISHYKQKNSNCEQTKPQQMDCKRDSCHIVSKTNKTIVSEEAQLQSGNSQL